MCRISAQLIAVLLLCLCAFAPCAFAEDGLSLSCNVVFDHYDGVVNDAISKDVVLVDYVHRPTRAVRVAEANGFEFGVRIYGTQEIDGRRLINNFQVTIKDMKRGISMSALSDSVYTLGRRPRHARIDLENGHSDGSDIDGDLLFECQHIE